MEKDMAIIKSIFWFFNQTVFRISLPKPTYTINAHTINMNNFLANMEASENVSFKDKGMVCFFKLE